MVQHLTKGIVFRYPKVRDLVETLLEQSLLPLISKSKHHTASQNHIESVLQDCLFQIYSLLEATPEFQRLIISAKRFTPASSIPVYKEILSETPHHRLTLVGVHRLMPIPIHDHPKVNGVQLIISGEVHIKHYEVAKECRAEDKLVKLDRVSNYKHKQGDFDLIAPLAGNIHCLKATKPTSILLSLQIPPCQRIEQSWFFPLDSFSNGYQPLIYRRFRSHTLHKLHTYKMHTAFKTA